MLVLIFVLSAQLLTLLAKLGSRWSWGNSPALFSAATPWALAHIHTAADTNTHLYPGGTLISLTPSRSVFSLCAAHSLVAPGESLESLYHWLRSTSTFKKHAALELSCTPSMTCLHKTSRDTHTHTHACAKIWSHTLNIKMHAVHCRMSYARTAAHTHTPTHTPAHWACGVEGSARGSS